MPHPTIQGSRRKCRRLRSPLKNCETKKDKNIVSGKFVGSTKIGVGKSSSNLFSFQQNPGFRQLYCCFHDGSSSCNQEI